MNGHVHIDYEGRSKADLKKVGAYRYAIDPSTEIFMCGVSADDSDRVLLWVNPKFGLPEQNEEAEEMIAKATRITAHNAPFELAVTWGALEQGKSCPFKSLPDFSVFRCTAAVARKAGLPSSLENLGAALGLSTQKDNSGKALIRFFCVPRKDGQFNEPKDFPEKWDQFCAYCVTDVKVEKLADQKLKAFELTGGPLETFLFDLRMNHRGIPVNVPALRNAQKIIDEVESTVTTEFRKLTGLNPTQREAVRLWLGAHGCPMPDMTAETVTQKIEVSAEARLVAENGGYESEVESWIQVNRCLTLYAKLSYAAVKKIPTMLDWVCPDGRMRGVLKYYGASTGRWTAGGPQIQNAKKATSEMKDCTPAAYAAVGRGIDAEALEIVYGDPYEVLASCVRHFVHEPGQEMLDGDYAAIEGRIGCWTSGQWDILDLWRKGVDLYKRAAAFVEEISEERISKESRNLGKVLELAAQFGLGTDGFIRTCANFGIVCDEEKAHRGIHEYYRPTHDKVVQRWYYMDTWMREALTTGGTHGPISVRTIAGIKFMLLKLPSGRSLAYPHPEINRREPTREEKIEMANGKNYPDKRFMEISYWGQLPMSTQWGRVRLWGSLAFQNETQAIAADFISHGAITAESRGMPPFALIHDQALSLKPADRSAADYEAALADLPAWAKGMPLKAECKVVNFYSK